MEIIYLITTIAAIAIVWETLPKMDSKSQRSRYINQLKNESEKTKVGKATKSKRGE